MVESSGQLRCENGRPDEAVADSRVSLFSLADSRLHDFFVKISSVSHIAHITYRHVASDENVTAQPLQRPNGAS